ncbi:type VI secretion system Vgr family protein [Burkholderia cepacia]|uniref:type VI secretion system Vgr family protein n=1 Tax=Burkholderia cepacia TaxID=292 RepID=UPI001CF3774F|nr:contractile injection system protein, VgrG/Pvc8 family [Burkholderia cepacia]MCA8023790.1 DUF2345 domain-containing protein [Burkholderia cepacia]
MDIAAALKGYSQATRQIQVDTAMPGAFAVERFHGREAMDESFRFEIDVLSSASFLDLNPLLGTAIRLRLATGAGERCWNGYVVRAAYSDSDGEITRYRLTMASWLELLRLRRNCLYFVGLDTEGICERVFGDYPEAGRRYELKEPLRTFDLRGQYRETDFDFVTRQLSEAGLSFRIEHAQDAGEKPSGDHTVVVFDRRAEQPKGSTVAYNRQDVGDPDGVMTYFTMRHQMVPDHVTAASWKAGNLVALAGHAQAEADRDAPVMPVREVLDAQRAGRFETSDQAQRYASQRLDALRLSKRIHYGAGSSRTLEIGKVHTLTGYPDGTVSFVPLTLEHEMQILADQSVRITSSDDRIDVLAKDAIVLQQGPSRITLKGTDILVETPGSFSVKAGAHPFMGPGAQSPVLPALPIPVPLALYDEQLRFVNEDGVPLSKVAYQLKLADGTTASGVTDDAGRTERVASASPLGILSALLTPTQLVDCCGRTSGTPPPPVEVKIKGVQTNQFQLGESEKSVTVKGHDRPLTAGEIEMARTVFKDGIDYDKVRVHRGSYFWFDMQRKRTAVTPNGHMYFRDEDFLEDFSAESVAEGDKSWFMHEMTHVWQYQLGYSVRWHGLTVTIRGESAYQYTITPQNVFHDYNMEQQGNLVADYFAIHVRKTYQAIGHRGYVGSPEELNWVLAPLLRDPKNADNLPK